ncbi:hypothetical protein ACLBXM_23740 [Xanthobacteraceae bacterium A53D]
MVAPGGKPLSLPARGHPAVGVRVAAKRGTWGDWVLFAAAYGVIMAAILFAYPPASLTQQQAAAGVGITVR